MKVYEKTLESKTLSRVSNKNYLLIDSDAFFEFIITSEHSAMSLILVHPIYDIAERK